MRLDKCEMLGHVTKTRNTQIRDLHLYSWFYSFLYRSNRRSKGLARVFEPFIFLPSFPLIRKDSGPAILQVSFFHCRCYKGRASRKLDVCLSVRPSGCLFSSRMYFDVKGSCQFGVSRPKAAAVCTPLSACLRARLRPQST